MNKILLITLGFSLPLAAYSQKMPSDYFAEAIAFMQEDQTPKAIDAFQYIVDNYSRNELYSRAYYNLGYSFFVVAEYDRAKDIFGVILQSQFDEKEALGGGLMSDPYANYRHRAADLLYQIYYETRDYDSSLYYLALSDTVYPYLHFCGNEYAAQDVQLSLRYADLHEKLGDPESAEAALLQSVFVTLADNSQVLAKLERRYATLADKEQLLAALDRGIERSYEKTVTRDGATYTYSVLRFRGTEIMLPYRFDLAVDAADRADQIDRLKETAFYRLIADL